MDTPARTKKLIAAPRGSSEKPGPKQSLLAILVALASAIQSLTETRDVLKEIENLDSVEIASALPDALDDIKADTKNLVDSVCSAIAASNPPSSTAWAKRGLGGGSLGGGSGDSHSASPLDASSASNDGTDERSVHSNESSVKPTQRRSLNELYESEKAKIEGLKKMPPFTKWLKEITDWKVWRCPGGFKAIDRDYGCFEDAFDFMDRNRPTVASVRGLFMTGNFDLCPEYGFRPLTKLATDRGYRVAITHTNAVVYDA